ncbi:MAG: putative selenium-dependent hydroxylase accessory protein YqeC [Chloroflexi bacterium]|nr:putative selenium-dependent hydroxylase accessory protein YqeC [Chloroflexota bacterium]
MLLSHALRVGPGSVVAFVGGGGKTAAMFRLAQELAPRVPVITTTTTRIFSAQISLAPIHVPVASPDDLPDLEQLLAERGDPGRGDPPGRPYLLLTAPPDPSDPAKAPGLSLETLGVILARTASLSPVVLVEADGSRMRPFKAPAAHEPVIPPQATHVVSVVGVDALGRPLRDEYVHRAALAAELAGAAPGDPVTPEVVAAVLTHPQGGLKGAPRAARVSALINKVESPAQEAAGREVAERVLRAPVPRAPFYNSALLASLRSPDPVGTALGRTAGVILAAGESRRFGGEPKQVAELAGKPLVAHVAQAALAAGLEQVLAVVGSAPAEVARALAGYPVGLVDNPGWSRGQSCSLQAGLREVFPGVDAVVFLLADQPTEKHAREVAWVEADERIFWDVDTPDDYRRLTERRGSERTRPA